METESANRPEAGRSLAAINREALDLTTRPEQDQTNETGGAGRKGRGFLVVFYILFTLFTLNILLGKASVQLGWDLPFLLGDVPEFLLLLVAAMFLMLAALRREKGQSGE